MEKFVSSRELAIFDVMASRDNAIATAPVKDEEQDFDRDSNNDEVDMIMNHDSAPLMRSPIRFEESEFVGYRHEPPAPTLSQSPRVSNQVETSSFH